MSTLNNFVNTIKTATISKILTVRTQKTKINLKILQLMYRLGYINNYFIEKDSIKVYLKYYNNKSVINNITLILKSSRPSFQKKKNIIFFKYFKKNGFTVYNTSKGLLTDVECLLVGVGGEPLIFIE